MPQSSNQYAHANAVSNKNQTSSRDATKMSHTHERTETKKNELVYIRLKVSRVTLPQSYHAHKIKIHVPAIVLRNQKD